MIFSAAGQSAASVPAAFWAAAAPEVRAAVLEAAVPAAAAALALQAASDLGAVPVDAETAAGEVCPWEAGASAAVLCAIYLQSL